MSQTLTLSAPLAMSAVPALMLIGGVVVGIALRGDLRTNIAAARLVAENDARTARWLWLNGYRRTPHAGPDVTEDVPAIEADHVDAEVLHVEHATGELPMLSDRPAEDEDEVGDEQHGEAVSEAPARLWQRLREQLTALWSRRPDYLKSNDQLAREFIADADKQPWVLYDEDELRRGGMDEEEIAAFREGFVKLPSVGAQVHALRQVLPPSEDDEERRVVIETWVERTSPTPPSYKPWHLDDVTALHEVVRPGRHRAPEAVVPAQRDGGEN